MITASDIDKQEALLSTVVDPAEVRFVNGVRMMTAKGLIQSCRAVLEGRIAGNRHTARVLLAQLERSN